MIFVLEVLNINLFVLIKTNIKNNNNEIVHTGIHANQLDGFLL